MTISRLCVGRGRVSQEAVTSMNNIFLLIALERSYGSGGPWLNPGGVKCFSTRLSF